MIPSAIPRAASCRQAGFVNSFASRGVAHVAALDEHLRHSGQIEPAEVVADGQARCRRRGSWTEALAGRRGEVARERGRPGRAKGPRSPGCPRRPRARDAGSDHMEAAVAGRGRRRRARRRPRRRAPRCRSGRARRHTGRTAGRRPGSAPPSRPAFEDRPHPAGDVEGERRLRVAGVGRRARGVALLAVRADVHQRLISAVCRALPGLWPGSRTTTPARPAGADGRHRAGAGRTVGDRPAGAGGSGARAARTEGGRPDQPGPGGSPRCRRTVPTGTPAAATPRPR